MRPQTSRNTAASAEVDALIQHLIRLDQSGCGKEALMVAQAALAKHGKDSNLLNVLAVIAMNQGQADLAVSHWQASLRLNPQAFLARLNLGRYFFTVGRYREAEAIMEKAAALRPNHPEALLIRGALHSARGQLTQAIKLFKRILDIDPAHSDALNNLGVALLEQRHFSQAQQCFEQLAQLPGQASLALARQARLASEQGNDEQAGTFYAQALAIDPYNEAALVGLTKLHAVAVSFEAPQRFLRKALADRGPRGALLIALADTLARTGQLDEARALLEQARQLPLDQDARIDLGRTYYHAGELDKAAHSLRATLAEQPDNPAIMTSLALVELASGDFEHGWQHYEGRWAMESHTAVPATPRWQGQALSGKTLLVLREQGFGDEIQFFRLLPELQRLHGCQIIVCCAPALAPLFEGQADIRIHVTDDADNSAWPEHDCWAHLMSLPLHMGIRLDNIPARLPYLKPAPERVAQWASRLSGTSPKVGLVWRGNPDHANDHQRSLPGLAVLAPLWQAADVQFISLQKGKGEDEAAAPPARQPLLALGGDIQDFADSAAVLSKLDLVICIDSAIAHLAGALGVRCWLMLPAVLTDWRWLRAGDDSAWYPEVMRLYRQTTPGDWQDVVARIAADLAAWAKE